MFMRVIIQRVKEASCTVDGQITGKIGKGFVVLLGVKADDTEEGAKFLAEKVANMRLFESEGKEFDKSLIDINGEVLAISQFTLYADASKGRRPSFDEAAKSDVAEPLYKKFTELLRSYNIKVEEGIFGAMMDIQLLNYGPATIILDSK